MTFSEPAGTVAELDFSERVALVTGAASGIGRATAMLFAERGAIVIAADISNVVDEELAGAIGADGSAVPLDVTSSTSWMTAIDSVVGRRGRLDILVNCAGISLMDHVLDVSAETFRRVVAVNQEGTFLGIKTAGAAMRETGGGAIVNVTSIGAHEGFGSTFAYGASKSAVVAMTKIAANDLAQFGIRVNAVAPGIIATPMQSANTPEQLAHIEEILKLPGRRGTATEVAQAIGFLASDMASYITGAEILIDGGVTLGGAS